ncbi:gamma-glutamyltransferase family protein [Verticiella sediminum]|uniref:Gamma-glutamyltransferase family protein n=1 Tax=Verticiella sediminum TaxID=1247510 RepID=A0A556ABL1_9BURK|nr:gamma-glutamyltransferase family protein [Verticiella sediminum]TSH90282.1 gamma-glutamyltransferase family protein [Verticiella sediminum]
MTIPKRSWRFIPLALTVFLASCSSGSDGPGGLGSPGASGPQLAIDTDPASCSIRATDGASVVVGSGVQGDPAAPEPASGYRLGSQAKQASRYMVVSATPLASKAGCDVLRAGGSAVDAAVAVQAVLGLVEPQSSTIAGSAFMMYYDAAKRTVTAYDGRESAPAAANGYYLARQVQDDPGSPAPVPSARRSGRSIGVPGVMRMLELAHEEHGRLAWSALFDDGVRLADDGFQIPSRMASAIASNAANFALDAEAMATFFHPDGTPRAAGETMTNPAYARSLRALAQGSADALHTGPLAQAIVAKAGQSVGDDAARTPITPSLMTLRDLADYRPKKREPVCIGYRVYYVCTMAPPSSGGIAVAQTLGMLAHFDLARYAPTDPANEGGIPNVVGVHLVAEAERLAYADRDKYVADTDFVPLPGQGVATLLDPAYLKSRAGMIDLNTSLGTAPPGDLGDVPLGIDRTPEHGTTHFSIVDAYGNAVSMTSTVESSMGSFHMVEGFLLTNQLTDFSSTPVDARGTPIANRVAPGKRPRSTMAPTLVFRGDGPDAFVMATGSPGGGTIIQYVVKTLVGALDWNLDAQQAASLVNFGSANSPSTSVDGANTTLDLTQLVQGLRALGHTVSTSAQSSGISTIMRVERDGSMLLEGGADPRREGLTLGNGAT